MVEDRIVDQHLREAAILIWHAVGHLRDPHAVARVEFLLQQLNEVRLEFRRQRHVQR